MSLSPCPKEFQSILDGQNVCQLVTSGAWVRKKLILALSRARVGSRWGLRVRWVEPIEKPIGGSA